jgi:hypothetical protein
VSDAGGRVTAVACGKESSPRRLLTRSGHTTPAMLMMTWSPEADADRVQAHELSTVQVTREPEGREDRPYDHRRTALRTPPGCTGDGVGRGRRRDNGRRRRS